MDNLDGTDSLLIPEASGDVLPVGDEGAQTGGGDDEHVPNQAEVVDVDQGAVPGEVEDWQAGLQCGGLIK